MEKLLEKLKNITLKNSIEIEEKDPQYISLKNLYLNFNWNLNSVFYLPLIIANSIICYQLSSSGEAYWEEFSQFFSKNQIKNIDDLIEKLWSFITNSKWNKRFIKIKLNRIEKLKTFLENFITNEKYYYENMESLQKDLAETLNQKPWDKTIVFWVKMFSYWARNYFNTLIFFPSSIPIPIDSRLTKLYDFYNTDKNLKITDFYKILSQKLNIPALHLDAVLWIKNNL